MERVAQCQCGSLRAIVSAETFDSYLCHCQACQRRTGSVVHAGAYFREDQVRPEGPSKVYSRMAPSGFAVHFRFCPTYGTSVYWKGDKRAAIRPDYIGVAVGCFTDPTYPAPTRSVWEASRYPWLVMPPGMDHLELGINPDGSPMTR